MLVTSNHANDKWTKRSRTGFMIYTNMSLINWHWKKWCTIKKSVFGVPFVATKVGVNTLHDIWCKFKMMGIQIPGSIQNYGDKMSFIYNTLKLDSTIRKKCNVITYHDFCESVTIRELLTGHNQKMIQLTHNKAGHWAQEIISFDTWNMWHIWYLTIGKNNIPDWKTCSMAVR